MSRESAMTALGAAPTPVLDTSSTLPIPEVAPTELKSTPFTQMAKKEADIVRMREEIKRDRDLINSEREQLGKIKSTYDEYVATKSKDPIAALKMLGFTEADVLNYLANEQPEEQTPEQKAIEAAQKATEERLKAFETAQEQKIREAEKKADQQLVQSYRNDVAKIVKADPDQFEYCNYFGESAQEQIYLTAKEIAKTGEAVSPAEITQMIEDYYEQEDRAMSQLKKRNAFLKPQPAEGEVMANEERTSKITPGFPNEPQPKPVITRTRTLHSAATATSASARMVRNETSSQKRERLMEALRNGAKL
jgi:hypothetical protein